MTFREFMSENGYTVQTTFWEDFTMADFFGLTAIKDTYSRAFEEWKEDYKFLTELVLVLNHKLWQHYKDRPEVAALYNDLWEQADRYAVENLKELLVLSKDVENQVNGYWSQQNVTIKDFHALAASIAKIRAFWDEGVSDYPNSTPHYEGYWHFLIESNTDFRAAILQRHRQELVESGHNFNVDTCFRRFVIMHPHYLKNKILDVKGYFIASERKGGSQSSKSSSLSMSSSSTMSTISVGMEDELGKTMINHARMRLAVQRSLEGKKAKGSKNLWIATVVAAILGFACGTFIFAYFRSRFNERRDTVIRIEYTNQVRLNLYSASVCLAYHWAEYMGNLY